MRKLITIFICLISLSTQAQLKDLLNKLPINTEEIIGNADIAEALREALDQGIEKQVDKLTQTDGFYKNELVKILFPEDIQKVDKALRNVGLGHLADEGIKVLNRAAEDAVSEATPIFVNAVKEITFNDAKNILMGEDNAATLYLTDKTQTELYQKFHPVINASFKKVGADKIWEALISKYNSLPFTKDVNPYLTDYVTKEALEGVYTMIAVEEANIRTDISSRTTDLLQDVFAMQD
ncbi:DUF4197 domain-containing protein [Mangrovimonas xylaniphaga]|uniref:DUF4197 domain-containing protein n=1 Tax=Mangrovimonas xylaniphaga TaxID=1645915 RepID=UPI0006B69569|nr:DUF4197 domain-containing protein [Mangrovimonas xylaniphaga]